MRNYVRAVLAALVMGSILAGPLGRASAETSVPVRAAVGAEVSVTIAPSGAVAFSGSTVPVHVTRRKSANVVVITVVPQ